jgi:hypothetical protein
MLGAHTHLELLLRSKGVTFLAIPDDHMEEVLREYQEKERRPSDGAKTEVIAKPADYTTAEWQEVTQAQQ